MLARFEGDRNPFLKFLLLSLLIQLQVARHCFMKLLWYLHSLVVIVIVEQVGSLGLSLLKKLYSLQVIFMQLALEVLRLFLLSI